MTELSVKDLQSPRADALELIRQLEDSGALTTVALTLEDALPLDRYEALATLFGTVKESCSFWIGDLLNYVEIVYGDTYAQVAHATGLGIDTLRDYKWVCGAVPRKRRRDTLAFGHHKLVAALEPADQTRWLKAAEKNAWSRGELREQIRAAGEEPPRPEQPQWTPAAQLAETGSEPPTAPLTPLEPGEQVVLPPPAPDLTDAVRRLLATATPLGSSSFRVPRARIEELVALVDA